MTKVWGIWNKIPTMDNCRVAVLREVQTARCLRNGFSEELRGNTDYWANVTRERIGDGLRLGPFVEFYTWESGKMRHVRCYIPEDAMCVRACVQVMEPAVYRRMSVRSCCPVRGRGGLYLARLLLRYSRRAENTCRVWNKAHPGAHHPWKAWAEEWDLEKYFDSLLYSIMHEVMWRNFGEPEIRNLAEVFLGGRDGLPIGAGYSAMIANMVLAALDFIIEGHRGCLGYARNLDNGTAITKSVSAAHDIRHIVEEWCAEKSLKTHEWSLFPVGHHAIERGGWRIENGRILAGTKVTLHILHLMRKPPEELTPDEMLALASLYGYIKHGESLVLKALWRDGGYNRIFKTISVSAKEAETNRIITERKAT